MSVSIKDRLDYYRWQLGFSSIKSMNDVIEEDGYDYFRTVSIFAIQIGKTYGLASEMYDEAKTLVGDVEELEERKKQLLNFLEDTPFGQVHAWIVRMWDEAPE